MYSRHDLEVLVEAKKEYQEEIINILTPVIKGYYSSLYDKVVEANKVHKLVLREFQTKLKTVSLWGDGEKGDIMEDIRSKSSHIDRAIQNAFLVKSQIYQIMNKGRATFKMISPEVFVYACFLKGARQLWKNPQLLYHKVPRYEYQQHVLALDKLIRHVIKECLREAMQIKDIIADGGGAAEVPKEVGNDGKHTYMVYDTPVRGVDEVLEGCVEDAEVDAEVDEENADDDDYEEEENEEADESDEEGSIGDEEGSIGDEEGSVGDEEGSVGDEEGSVDEDPSEEEGGEDEEDVEEEGCKVVEGVADEEYAYEEFSGNDEVEVEDTPTQKGKEREVKVIKLKLRHPEIDIGVDDEEKEEQEYEGTEEEGDDDEDGTFFTE
jgi:Family of unknown function (DUF5764)